MESKSRKASARLLYAVVGAFIIIFSLVLVGVARYSSTSITQGTTQVQPMQNYNTVSQQTGTITRQTKTVLERITLTLNEHNYGGDVFEEVQGSGFSPEDTTCSVDSNLVQSASDQGVTINTSCTITGIAPDGSATIDAYVELELKSNQCFDPTGIAGPIVITITGDQELDSASITTTSVYCPF